MSENLPLAERLKQQRVAENESLASLTKAQLTALRKGLNDILQEELNTMRRDMKAQIADFGNDYDKSKKSLQWRIVKSRMFFPWLTALMFCAAIFLSTWGTAQYYRNQIPALQEQVSDMSSKVVSLQARGGKMKTSSCDGHFCVEIDPNSVKYGTGGENYRIVRGY